MRLRGGGTAGSCSRRGARGAHNSTTPRCSPRPSPASIHTGLPPARRDPSSLEPPPQLLPLAAASLQRSSPRAPSVPTPPAAQGGEVPAGDRTPGEQSSSCLGEVLKVAGGFCVCFAPALAAAKSGDGGGAVPPPMSTPGSKARAIGLAILLVSVSAGINFGAGGGLGLLLGFIGILTGVGLVVAGVRMADSPAPIAPAAFDGARALAALLLRHLPVVGLVMASSAVTLVSGDAAPVLCFTLFTLFLLGLSLMNLSALGE